MEYTLFLLFSKLWEELQPRVEASYAWAHIRALVPTSWAGWAGCLVSLGLSVCVCKVGVIMLSPRGGCERGLNKNTV